MFKNKIILIILLVMIIIGIASYFILPDKVPIHWGIDGKPNSYANKFVAAALAPIIALIVLISSEYTQREMQDWKKYFVLVLLICVQLFTLVYAKFLM